MIEELDRGIILLKSGPSFLGLGIFTSLRYSPTLRGRIVCGNKSCSESRDWESFGAGSGDGQMTKADLLFADILGS
jgi:hypothetical protein